jgi:hypothetical protein
MWKLINCGTYLWFVMEKKKYFHCVYSNTGEYKKLKVNEKKYSLYAGHNRMYLVYLKTWPIATAKCILDRKAAKFYIKHWKNLHRTKRMKEIIKQLKAI